MALTDALCRSYLDLRWHGDPAEGSVHGIAEADRRLGAYDDRAIDEQRIALRAIAGAVEALDVESAEDELDRTILLEAIRTDVRRLEEAPHRRDPVFWVRRLGDALLALLLRPEAAGAEAALERLRALPEYLQAARDTLRHPPSLFTDAAVAMLPGVTVLLDDVWRRAAPFVTDRDALDRAVREAVDALATFRVVLLRDIEAAPDERAFAAGEDPFEHRLHHEHALQTGVGEAWRVVMHRGETVLDDLVTAALAVDPQAEWREVVERIAAAPPSEDAGGAVEPWGRIASEWAARRDILAEAPVAPVVLPLPEYLAPVAPWGGYLPAPARAGTGPAIAFVTDEALAWFGGPWLAATRWAAHGMATRSTVLDRAVRRHLANDASVAGWGLYLAGAMASRGFCEDPEERIRFLFAQYYATQRALLDLGLHTRQWTAREGLAFLTSQTPIPEDLARCDLRDVALHPAQATATVLDWREFERLGGGAARHERILSFGALPPAMIAWGLEIAP